MLAIYSKFFLIRPNKILNINLVINLKIVFRNIIYL